MNLRFVCLLLVVLTQTSFSQSKIRFTYIPGWGSAYPVTGRVAVNPSDYGGVALFIWVPGYGWVIKPTLAAPVTSVAADSTWEANYATGGNDVTCAIFAAFLLKKGFTPPGVNGAASLPKALYDSSADSAMYYRESYPNTLNFAGMSWRMRSTALHNHGVAPGSILFSDSAKDVYADSSGLHLSLQSRNGKVFGTEVYADMSLGYGKYLFTVQADLTALDVNAVFGAYTFDPDAPANQFREIDFEAGRWGESGGLPLQYAVQPVDQNGNRMRFGLTPGTRLTTHVILWAANGINFRSYYGGSEITDSLFNGSDYRNASFIPQPGDGRWRFNLRAYNGVAPASAQSLLVKKFSFSANVPLGVLPGPGRSSAEITWAVAHDGTLDFFVVLPQAGRIELSLYDVAGKKIAVILNGKMAAGRHSISWPLRGKGMAIVELKAAGLRKVFLLPGI